MNINSGIEDFSEIPDRANPLIYFISIWFPGLECETAAYNLIFWKTQLMQIYKMFNR